MRRVVLAAVAALSLSFIGAAAASEGGALPDRHWSFSGIFGTIDKAAAQRGLQVYREVCAGCHSLSLLSYRHLAGIGLDEDGIKAIAAEATVVDGPDDAGEMFERPGRPADRFAAPFPNEKAARAANNGAYPPDLSVITKARAGGANYVFGILTGYGEAPADLTMQEGMNYNTYFPGLQIAMPAPLSEGSVEYADGTPATVEQMASDVTMFMTWAAEPETDARKRMGIKAMLFLLVLTGLFYATKRKVWAALH
jgi:ubiquinol-cytochrome c reductase cytochrome c1 subunit